MRRVVGYTLVEVSVAGLLLAVLVALIVSELVFTRSAVRVEDLAGELNDAMHIQEVLTTDLFALAPAKSSPVRYWPDDASRLAFYVAEPALGGAQSIDVRAVQWRLEPGTKLLMRECSGHDLSVGHSPLVSVSFAPMDGPTGYLLRTSLQFAAHGPGRSVAYTFITRIPQGSLPVGYGVNILSDFQDPSAALADQVLPRI